MKPRELKMQDVGYLFSLLLLAQPHSSLPVAMFLSVTTPVSMCISPSQASMVQTPPFLPFCLSSMRYDGFLLLFLPECLTIPC